jgi:trk system potassium uptake protein
MYIVIIGGGKLGAYLATTLLRDGHQVALVEKSEPGARRLSETIDGSCLVINGDGCSATVQDDAGAHQADIFVAATGQDEDNLAACEIASRVYEVPRCIARVNSPRNLRIFRRMGIESVSSTALIAHMIQEEAMLGSMGVAVSLTNDQVGLMEIKVPTMRYHDNYKGVRALDVEFDDGIRLVAVSHGDEVEVVATETRIMPGDQVIVAADTDLMQRAREIVRSL